MSGVPRYLRPAPQRVLMLPRSAWTLVLGAAILAAVEIVTKSGRVSRLDLVPVETMISRAAHLLTTGNFVSNDLVRSVAIILVSFVAASVLGIFIAWAMHSSAWLRRAITPFLSVYYAVPSFALYPVVVVMFGVGVVPIAITSTVFAVVIVIINALQGFDSVPVVVDKLAASLRMSRRHYVRSVLFRSAIPGIATALKFGLSYSIIAVLATEFILSTQGLGWFISQSYNNFAIGDMYGAILIVGLLALITNVGFAALLNRFDWRRR